MTTVTSPMTLPPALPQFAHVNRYWDLGRQAPAAKILPGEYYVTVNDELITTVLGSCVSACIRDPEAGVGGMNHFMLPAGAGQRAADATGIDQTRYGNHAMDQLIEAVVRAGGRRRCLEAKVFGGGRVMSGMTDVGRSNIEFVLHYLEAHRIPVAGQDLGDVYPRKVVYLPRTGAVLVKKLKTRHNDTILRREEDYLHALEAAPAVAGLAAH